MTTALTPNAANHDGLGPMDSRFVETHTMPWETTRYPGVEAKTLLVDRRTGLLTVLLKMAPGAMLPDHEHVQIEQTFVIEGALVCAEGTCSAGNFVWRPAGSRHQAGTPNGGLMLATFQLPNKFFEADGSATDMLGQEWNAFWGGASGNSL
ncbi:MAG: hypothetical protein HN478_05800 [Rhodospirillaceae bacterium]|jgi:anti-sigma factor ChrR (cupin superfamily)|nr:hypothetical protein [Rhodospirillaceae bacterium]MBT5195088.1 hypothetical protein [Rhodospirillaceae bacterium]MBT7760678.1 hypothetical protein [Rhodospirillaceae bacterium]